ncbi:membrane-spanning 4-domains subfamily A member 12 [Thomomys bottae]
MRPSNPTLYPGMQETMLNPYPSSNPIKTPESQQPMAPGYQQSPVFRNQAQGGQFPLVASPGLLLGSQMGQGNVIVSLPEGPAAVKLKEEGKALGAIQIIMGLMHIGFGSVLFLLLFSTTDIWGFVSIASIGGYPFWGGLSFIISGALSVSASKEFSPCLVKGSIGMNIVSSILAIIGIILFLVDLVINKYYHIQDFWALISGRGITSLLLIFSILEIGIASATAHFGCRAVAKTNRPALAIPNMYAANPMTQSLPPAPQFDDHPTGAPK